MSEADKQQNLIIYHTAGGKAAVSLYARDDNVWMNQNQLAELFATSVPNINTHISKLLKEKELDANSVIKDYLITAADGSHLNPAAPIFVASLVKNSSAVDSPYHPEDVPRVHLKIHDQP